LNPDHQVQAVLEEGYDPNGYAELLVDLARSVKRGGALITAWGSSIGGSTLPVRIRRILTDSKSPALSRTQIALLTVFCAGAILIPSLLTLAPAQAMSPIQPMISTLPSFTAAERTNQTNQPKMQTEQEKAGNPLPHAGQEAAAKKADLPSESMLMQTGKDLLERSQFKEARLGPAQK
jgi:hypothetical protein